MTKKHFIAIAAKIAAQHRALAISAKDHKLAFSVGAAILDSLADSFADDFAANNPNFDRARFLAACRA